MLTERFGEETAPGIVHAPEMVYSNVREQGGAKVLDHSSIA